MSVLVVFGVANAPVNTDDCTWVAWDETRGRGQPPNHHRPPQPSCVSRPTASFNPALAACGKSPIDTLRHLSQQPLCVNSSTIQACLLRRPCKGSWKTIHLQKYVPGIQRMKSASATSSTMHSTMCLVQALAAFINIRLPFQRQPLYPLKSSSLTLHHCEENLRRTMALG